MPIIDLGSGSADAELVARLPSTFESTLPPAGGLIRDVAPAFKNLNAASFGAAHFANAQALSGSMARRLAITTGWADDSLGDLRDLVSEALRPLAAEAIAQMFDALSAVVPNALDAFADALDNAITSVPFIGWIAKVGFATWRGVKEAQKDYKIAAQGPALGYDKAWDEQAANEALGILASKAWTNVFAPPKGALSWKTIAYTSSGQADGVAWGQLDADPSDAWGLVPGVAAIAGYWQTPRNQPHSSHWARPDQIVSQAQLLPSISTLGGMVWTNAQRPTPQIGMIDYAGLKSKWADYGDELRAFWTHEGGGYTGPNRTGNRGDWFADQIREGFSWLDANGQPKYAVKPSDVSEQWRNPWLDYLARGMIERAYVRAVQSLATEAVAYIRDDAPLLTGDPVLRTVVSKYRTELLQSPRRVNVDLALVPHGEYRTALITSLENSPHPASQPCGPGHILIQGHCVRSPIGGPCPPGYAMVKGRCVRSPITLDGKPIDPPDPPVPGVGGGGGDTGGALLAAAMFYFFGVL